MTPEEIENLKDDVVYILLRPYRGKANKKWTIYFADGNEMVLLKVNFGAGDMEDYTIHKDKQRLELFKKRFNKRIEKNKNNPFSAMTLSDMILWNKPTLKSSLEDYANKFKFKLFVKDPIHYI